jgi:murein DD-endopeptidase MepM/ murein hydrolase activator NlpD
LPAPIKAFAFLISGLVLAFLVLTLLTNSQHIVQAKTFPVEIDLEDLLKNKCPVADGFDFPVGPPDAKGYYDAQPFGANYHLGEDWNGKGGGNSDLGDYVYSIADGIVVYANDAKGGWGNVVRIVHNIGAQNNPVYVESLYGHLKDVLVNQFETVKRGQAIGTIGNLDGFYLAHLHFEIRTNIYLGNGMGYSMNTSGYVQPTAFIKAHRP